MIRFVQEFSAARVTTGFREMLLFQHCMILSRRLARDFPYVFLRIRFAGYANKHEPGVLSKVGLLVQLWS